MVKNLLVHLTFGMFSLLFSGEVFAKYVIYVDNGSVFTAGQSDRQVSVWAYHTFANDSVDRFLNGFRLGFDFDEPGKGVNANFTGLQVTYNPAFSFNQNTGVGLASFSNFDVRGEAGLPLATQNTVNLKGVSFLNKVHLFTLTFDISQSTPEGTYKFVFRPDAQTTTPTDVRRLTIGTTSVTALTNFETSSSSLGGSFYVQAVPEPGSVVLMTVGLTTFLVSRKRRFNSLLSKIWS